MAEEKSGRLASVLVRIGCGLAAAALLGGIGVACSSEPESLGVTKAPLVVQISIPLPPKVAAQAVAVGANGALRIADRARVVSTTPHPPVANLGAGETNVGVEARTGDLYSRSSVTLRDRARVEGTLRTSGTVIRHNQTVVTGAIVQGAVLSPPDAASWSVDFPNTNQGNVDVPPDQTRTLAPGSYGALSAFSRATLRLSSGTYFFTSATIEPQARWTLATTNGPVVVYVKTSLNFKGTVVDSQGAARHLLVYLGNEPTVVETPFTGTLVAPNALLTLASTTHTGAFFARDVELRPDAKIVHRPFPSLPPGTCTGTPNGTACDDGNPCTLNDACSAGTCTGATKTCAASQNQCAQNFCSPNTGECLEAPADGKACNDGDPATTNDVCINGVCSPAPPGGRCASMEQYEGLLQQDSAFRARRQQIARAEKDWLARAAAGTAFERRANVFVIPVVVHVLWNTAEQNITEAQIQSQIDRLNLDYRRLNADSGSVPAEFTNVAADVQVEFRLAVRDPNCQATTGITRRQLAAPALGSSNLVNGSCPTDDPAPNDACEDHKFTSRGGTDAWPRDRYLNIWVAPLSGGLLGRSSFPGYPAEIDGVVVDTFSFGEGGTAEAPFDLGRTAVHEIGHWLGLWHTFQDSCSGLTPADCGTLGDECCDTPAATVSTGCPGIKNSCVDDPERNDQTMNYMDYTDDACMFMLSGDQGLRVAATLNTTRSAILGSDGLIPPPSVASFDLWSQDTPDDIGAEPNSQSGVFWVTDDIWVRNDADGRDNHEHENPLFRASGPPNRVYVRVRNRGCQAAENANLSMYWAKASTELSWPAPWDGSVTAPAQMGNPISTQSTGTVPPGGSTILEFEWSPPDPANYASFGADASHFCLLSRIQTSATAPFGMTSPETSDLVANVSNNNNIVWKNVTVATDGTGARVSVGGPPDAAPTRLVFTIPEVPRNPSSLFTWGSVEVDLGADLFARWQQGGSEGTSISPIPNTTRVRLLSSGATLANIPLNPLDVFTIGTIFRSNSSSEGPRLRIPAVYLLDVAQFAQRSGGDVLIGGQRFALKTRRPVLSISIPEPY